VDNIVWWSTKELSDDGELIDVVLSREQRLAFQHLCKDAARTPDINLNIILLPCEHNLRGSVVSRGDITGHLGILNTGQTKVADLEIAVLIDEDVAGLEIAMDDACRMNILETPLFTISLQPPY
jgi:hypothetical protein